MVQVERPALRVRPLMIVTGRYDRDSRELVVDVVPRTGPTMASEPFVITITGRRTDQSWNGVSWCIRRRDDAQLLADGFQPGWTEALDAAIACVEQEGATWAKR